MREDNAGIRERELTSGRSPAAIAVALLALLGCLYALLEVALRALGQEAWLAAPDTWWHWGSTLPGRLEPAAQVAIGLCAAFLGLVLLLHGLRRGRHARHALACEDGVLVVDDQVLAASLARRARAEAGVGPGQALVTVNRDRVDVQLSPTSGTPINPALVVAGLEDELRTNLVEPLPQVHIRVAERGVIGQ
ncbi:hypothetical protein KRR55_10020 [Paeniglutamicibacter sp. ABSL32-1]|uniref:hypothetical protein n=1 Tax=Paeniglutamicibacter quisquiliarum TaxID=2849498 RepID=UPI001C2DB2B6|nr:hypothetical protein [Paeniglutamicibacter quisquiliarum]MBV1779448.1 hypothetical protein [Paeniglutamicibacter quisquiliarum]